MRGLRRQKGSVAGRDPAETYPHAREGFKQIGSRNPDRLDREHGISRAPGIGSVKLPVLYAPHVLVAGVWERVRGLRAYQKASAYQVYQSWLFQDTNTSSRSLRAI